MKDVEYFKCHKKGHYANKCPKSRLKTRKGRLKYAKWMILVSKNRGKRNLFVRFVSGIRISMRSEKILLFDIRLFYLTWDK